MTKDKDVAFKIVVVDDRKMRFFSKPGYRVAISLSSCAAVISKETKALKEFEQVYKIITDRDFDYAPGKLVSAVRWVSERDFEALCNRIHLLLADNKIFLSDKTRSELIELFPIATENWAQTARWVADQAINNPKT